MSSLIEKTGDEIEGGTANDLDEISMSANGDGNKEHLKLALTSSMGGEDTAATDSDGDVLGVLDFSPDGHDEHSIISPAGDRYTTFTTVFDPMRFSELMPHTYIRNTSVSVRVTDMQTLPSSFSYFNQCVFTIVLQHGSVSWTITRKSRHIQQLHTQLRLFKTMLRLPAATNRQRERRQSMRVQMKLSLNADPTVKPSRLVRFPRKSLRRMDSKTPSALELYLSNLLLHPLLRSHCAVLEFFEISGVSFLRHVGPKLKEGFVRKRSGGRDPMGVLACCSACCRGRYKRRWLVLRESCVFCIAPGAGNLRTVMLVDSAFQVSHGFRHTGVSKGILITNLTRTLVLKCDGEESAREWSSAIENMRTKAIDFTGKNRYGSFAPVRNWSYARWYVDGSWYMSDVADLLELAQEEIFITDWWLSPDIYMKRPDLTGRQWKLSEILKRQASRGVKIFILLYKEVEWALSLNSLYTKRTLCQLHANIKVLRHPDHIAGRALYWAHHEKMVIIDQMHAFVGGIDLCYGRWDDYRHKLVDVGHGGRVTPKVVVSPPGVTDAALGRLVLNTRHLFDDTLQQDDDEDEEEAAAQRRRQRHGSMTSSSERTETSHNLNDTPVVPSSSSDEAPTRHASFDESYVVLEEGTHVSREMHATSSSASLAWSGEDHTATTTSPTTTTDSPDDVRPMNQIPLSLERRTVKKPELKRQDDIIKPQIKIEDEAYFGEEEDDDEVVRRRDGAAMPSRRKLSKKLHAVRSIGLDLVEEMKEKKREVRHWTEKKVPGLRRTCSVESEIGLNTGSEDDDPRAEGRRRSSAKAISFHRLRHKLRSKTAADSTPKEKEVEKEPERNSLDVQNLRTSRERSLRGSLIDLHKELTYDEVTSVHLWLGKDYVNWITKDLDEPHVPFTDNVNRLVTPRMPWHDVAMYVEGPAARDAARHFIQRWNAVKSEKMKNNDRYPYLIPKTYKQHSFSPSFLQLKHRVKCQVVRSVCSWSAGIENTERSIYTAYENAIKSARHFIYIENQFIISSSNRGRSEIQNTIAMHLYERILQAFRQKETFRVYFVLPLLPAFEGQIGTPSGVAMQYILHYTYQTIITGPNSLLGMLESASVPWNDYLSFCSLRTHDELEGVPVTELIYVHSKLLIVDDRLVIAGSANINDRSMLGNRDSEVALVIEDEEFSQGVMDGREYARGVFAGGLRTYLFSEHLGLESADLSVNDPVADHFFFRTWNAAATKNAKIFHEVFGCIPSDHVSTFAELKQLRAETPFAKRFPEKARQMLKLLQGRLVNFPLMFLKDEVLKPGPTNKEYLLPIELWV